MPRISALPDGTASVATTNQLPVNQSGTTRRITVEQLQNAGTQYNSFDPRGAPTGYSSAKSDTFEDAGASATKWTLAHPGTNGSLSFSATYKRMTLQATGTGADSAVFAWQAAPSSEFTIAAYVALETPTVLGSAASAGIFVSQGNTFTSDDFYTLKHDQSTTLAEVVTQSWADYNGAVTGHTDHGRFAGGAYWFRIRVNGTTVSADVAYQDRADAWVVIDTRTLAYTPTHFGVIANTTKANPNVARAICTDFWCWDALSTFDAIPTIGKLVKQRQV